MSLHKWGITGKETFLGLGNYIHMFKDLAFWNTFGNSTLFMIISTPIMVIVALGLALICNMETRLKKLYRVSFFLPSVLSVSVISYLGIYIFNPSIGMANSLLKAIGILNKTENIEWLGYTNTAWIAIVIVTIWWTVGTNMLILLSALQGIPKSYYEVYDLESKNAIGKFRYILFPTIKPVLITVIFLQSIASYKIFPQIYYMTKGGPNGTTKPIIQYIYEQGFMNDRIGYAVTMSIPLFVVLFTFGILKNKVGKEGD